MENMINKLLLSQENISNSSNYEDFAMKILSSSEKGTNVFAITCDKAKLELASLVSLNVGYNIAAHEKKVLIINLDVTNCALNELLGKENDDDKVIEYGRVNIILPKTTDFVGNMTMEEVKSKYSDYDFVIFCVPSPKLLPNYLATPVGTGYYMIASKFISNYHRINKCMDMLNKANMKIIGCVYIKLDFRNAINK